MSAPTWYDIDPSRWETEKVAVLNRFPDFASGERQHPSRHLYWRGELQPFPTNDHVSIVAAHLEAQEPIVASETGELSVETPTRPPAEVPLDAALRARFTIEIVYLSPPALPRIYAMAPRIDDQHYPDHPHLNRGPTRQHPLRGPMRLAPNSDLCVIAPQDGLWAWPTHTAKDLLVWTSFWLGAHVIWQARGRQYEDWPLPAAPHDPKGVLHEVKPSQPCPCGSGLPFGKCCRDKLLALKRAAA